MTSSDDEVEDEMGMKLKNVDDQFLRLIPLLQKKDPKIYDNKVTFFPEPDSEEDPGTHKSIIILKMQYAVPSPCFRFSSQFQICSNLKQFTLN